MTMCGICCNRSGCTDSGDFFTLSEVQEKYQKNNRKHLHMDLPAYEEFEDEPEDDMMEL